jgi:sulfate adenylyltransferase subunit 1 (EFTu-like GTPase family)
VRDAALRALPLRFATAGRVSEGKSTLIGRLLYDARAIQRDPLAAVTEREAGIAVDVTYRYFATEKRKFIIADSPGHEHYTRNMATGASNADAIVLLVDAAKGLAPEARRHLEIARLIGIRQAVAFVNKMDLVGYSNEAFRRLDLGGLEAIPGSALRGDMVVERGGALGWYEGPTLLERLESFQSGAEQAAGGPFRFPVQLVSRPPAGQPRSCMGRIESGCVLAGAPVQVLPSGKRTVVRRIVAHCSERDIAVAGDSVNLVLADDIDIARGDLIAGVEEPPTETRALDITLLWLAHEPLRAGGRYVVQQSARRTFAKVSGDALGPNEIGRARLALHTPLFVDPYERVRATGALILIDEASNQAVAAGLVR